MVPKHRDDEGTPATVQLNFQDHRKVKSPLVRERWIQYKNVSAETFLSIRI